MKTAVPLPPTPLLAAPDPAATVALAGIGRRLAIYAELTKPRIAVMVLVTVATGFLLGSRTTVSPPTWLGTAGATTLLLALVGTGMVAGAASAWNQVVEASRDALMRRTARRPLPSGRIGPGEAATFATALGLAGVGLLAFGVNAAAAAVAAATFFLYVCVYTPMKPRTTLNTVVGAIPGALPPLIGWAAATGGVEAGGWSLFLIVFLWQFPHFLAIAWLHRDDYARGGHRMLPAFDPTGAMTARQAVLYGLTLIPAGLMPTAIGVAGPYYFAGALGLGLFYLSRAIRFRREVSDTTARGLLRASILYLPAVLALLLLDPSPA